MLVVVVETTGCHGTDSGISTQLVRFDWHAVCYYSNLNDQLINYFDGRRSLVLTHHNCDGSLSDLMGVDQHKLTQISHTELLLLFTLRCR